MNSDTLVKNIREAFSQVAYPGDEHIVHCEYDSRHGGSQDGPCRECTEIVNYFQGRSNSRSDHQHDFLSLLAFALHSFTPAAFCYWIPTFMEAVIKDTDRGSSKLSESIEFRFGPDEPPEWRPPRFALLTDRQLQVIQAFFEFLISENNIEQDEANYSLDLINRELKGRC